MKNEIGRKIGLPCEEAPGKRKNVSEKTSAEKRVAVRLKTGSEFFIQCSSYFPVKEFIEFHGADGKLVGTILSQNIDYIHER